jgi:hypothetical protein
MFSATGASFDPGCSLAQKHGPDGCLNTLEIAARYAALLIVAAGGPFLGEINATCGDDLRV